MALLFPSQKPEGAPHPIETRLDLARNHRLAILVFGLIAAAAPASSDPQFFRAIGVASMGMGLFGLLITVFAFRSRQRWAWFGLWYYPVFWTAHLAAGLPPDKEHVHQAVFIVLSLAGLLLPVREFFPPKEARERTPV